MPTFHPEDWEWMLLTTWHLLLSVEPDLTQIPENVYTILSSLGPYLLAEAQCQPPRFLK